MSYQQSRPKFFCGGDSGHWSVEKMSTVIGDPLSPVLKVEVLDGPRALVSQGWVLKGVTSHVRYVERSEKVALEKIQAPLGRSFAKTAVLIPISKSPAWWQLTQEERRSIIEDQSKHISYSMKYLPTIARQLYHSRDLGEPFDFLTWFEFESSHKREFCDLLVYLRQTPEWKFVTREIEVWLRLDEIAY